MHKSKLISVFILFVASVLMGIQSAQAQIPRPNLYLKGGLNLSNLYTDKIDDENVRVGFHAGLAADFPILKFLSLRSELLYSVKGTKGEYDISIFEGSQRFNLHYLDVPLLASVKLGRYVELHGGLYGAFLLGANIKTEGVYTTSEKLENNNFKPFDYGVSLGGQLNLNELVGFGLRFNQGLREVADSDLAKNFLGNSKNSVLQFSLSFKL